MAVTALTWAYDEPGPEARRWSCLSSAC